jgi:hypothetical protein
MEKGNGQATNGDDFLQCIHTYRYSCVLIFTKNCVEVRLSMRFPKREILVYLFIYLLVIYWLFI